MTWNYTKSAVIVFLGMIGVRMVIEYGVPFARYQDPLSAVPVFVVAIFIGVIADLIEAWRRRRSASHESAPDRAGN